MPCCSKLSVGVTHSGWGGGRPRAAAARISRLEIRAGHDAKVGSVVIIDTGGREPVAVRPEATSRGGRW